MKDMINELTLLCRDLRISSDVAVKSMTMDQATNQEFLLELLRYMKSTRANNRQVNMTRKAKFPYLEDFAQFRSDGLEFDDSFSLSCCMSLTFLQKKENIVMAGRAGTGKTMLSVCIGMKACENSVQAAYFRIPELVKGLGAFKGIGHTL